VGQPGEHSAVYMLMQRRFSTHPAIALPSLQPWEYGNVFIARAKSMLGSMLAVPSRETVIAFILLAHCGFANGECTAWVHSIDCKADFRLRVRGLDDDGTGCQNVVRAGSANGQCPVDFSLEKRLKTRTYPNHPIRQLKIAA
jgi:hypothetical protein